MKNPVKVVERVDDLGRASTQYRGLNSTVVMNNQGKIISAWSKNSDYWRIKD